MKPRKIINKWAIFWYYSVIKEIEWQEVRRFECICICWNIRNVRLDKLRWKDSNSCWCIRKRYKWGHWMTWTRFYYIYKNLKARCTNEWATWYTDYWERWIKNLWNSFIDFRDDMYKDYLKHEKKYWTKNTTIDRIDNEWNYHKSNCKWSTILEQSNNKRSNIGYYTNKKFIL
jgi:hypothetical protein